MFQNFVCVDSNVPGNPHFSIFCGWQGLMLIPLVIILYPILPAHLPVYPQGHLVVALPILSLGKLLASTDNVSYCFSGISLHFLGSVQLSTILVTALSYGEMLRHNEHYPVEHSTTGENRIIIIIIIIITIK